MGNAAQAKELHRYVGYAEIAHATGMDRRQIQRLKARGKFPKPDVIPTKENRWRLSVINAWLETRNAEQRAALCALAVADPSKLGDDELDATFVGAFSEWARRGGLSADTFLCAGVPVTAEQAEQHLRAANDALADAFARLDIVRGCLVSGGLRQLPFGPDIEGGSHALNARSRDHLAGPARQRDDGRPVLRLFQIGDAGAGENA